MSVEVVTKEDLQAFRIQLMNDIKALMLPAQKTSDEWLRSKEVQKKLKISPGTLQTYRVTGKLKSSKIGNIHFYRNTDVEGLLNANE